MSFFRSYAVPVAVLNIPAAGVAGVVYLFGGDLARAFYLVMLLEAGFAFIFAGWEDVRASPLGTALRRALFKHRVPYSIGRHKEALSTANRMVFTGVLLFAETILISVVTYVV